MEGKVMARNSLIAGSAILSLALAYATTIPTAHAQEPPESAATNVLEAAPTRGFFAMPTGSFISVVLGSDLTDIQRLNLPAGNFIVNASAVLATFGDVPRRVTCSLVVDNLARGEAATGVVGGAGVDVTTSLPITAGIRLVSRADLAVACAADEPGLVWSQPSPITAIKVDALSITHGLGFGPN
jgi:hypothetical protein